MSYVPPNDKVIAKVLRTSRTFAVIGASNDPSRPSYGVMGYLLAKGYTVIPINPGLAGSRIQGQRVATELARLRRAVDVVDIFRRPDAALDVVRAAIREKDRLGIRTIWMQLGVVNEQAADEARAAGLAVIMDRCPKIEFARLFAKKDANRPHLLQRHSGEGRNPRKFQQARRSRT